jgi:predicted small integral membrane protein
MIFTNLHAATTNTWNTVGKAKEKGLFDFDFIKWMAWTWPTASFFIFIALCITAMYFWEKKDPGGNPRKGVLTNKQNGSSSCFRFTLLPILLISKFI